MTQGGRRRALDAFPRRPPFDSDAPIPLTVYGINEPTPGPRWQALFAATWPGYRRWYLQRDVRARPSLQLAQDMLATHMPELVPTYEKMLELTRQTACSQSVDQPQVTSADVTSARVSSADGTNAPVSIADVPSSQVPIPAVSSADVPSSHVHRAHIAGTHPGAELDPEIDDVAARMLTLWDPPRFLPGCSQAVITEPEIAVCRNYDYSPELWERVVYSSQFGSRKVIGNSDCLWGLIDGMNSEGLVVSLSFGGRRGSGPGFAVSLVVRYLLEVAGSTEQAREILTRMPVAMAYNLTIVDGARQVMTAYVAPGRAAEFTSSPIATNHRGEVPDSIEHALRFASVERRECLAQLVSSHSSTDDLVAAFLRPPLYSTQYWRAFGTVYTALYRPAEGSVELHWPDRHWVRRFEDEDGTFDVVLRPS